MPKVRSIRPEIHGDERFAALPLLARELFRGLISLADDHGCFQAAPSHLRGLLFHSSPEEDGITVEGVARALQRLELARMVRLYQVDGRRYAEILGWRDPASPWGQRIQQVAARTVPAPPGEDEVAQERPRQQELPLGEPARGGEADGRRDAEGDRGAAADRQPPRGGADPRHEHHDVGAADGGADAAQGGDPDRGGEHLLGAAADGSSRQRGQGGRHDTARVMQGDVDAQRRAAVRAASLRRRDRAPPVRPDPHTVEATARVLGMPADEIARAVEGLLREEIAA